MKLPIECPNCNGTGLYKGSCERGDCAVICNKCYGSGKVDFEFTPFEGRKHREDVERVFRSSYGFVHTGQDFTSKDGKLVQFSKGGCTYQEWLDGGDPKPVKELYCPYVWDNRGAGNAPCSRCEEGLKWGSSIKTCKYFGDKAKCWEELAPVINWDKLFPFKKFTVHHGIIVMMFEPLRACGCDLSVEIFPNIHKFEGQTFTCPEPEAKLVPVINWDKIPDGVSAITVGESGLLAKCCKAELFNYSNEDMEAFPEWEKHIGEVFKRPEE